MQIQLTNGELKNSTNMLALAGMPKTATKAMKTQDIVYIMGDTLGLT